MKRVPSFFLIKFDLVCSSGSGFFSGRLDPDPGQLHPEPPLYALIYPDNISFIFYTEFFFRPDTDPVFY